MTWSPTPDSTHPLQATGGTTPNPITNVGTVAFANPGIHGFDCAIHGDAMHGAVWVEAN